MESNYGWFLGDSGYPLKKGLITPLCNPSGQQEINFNLAHTKTRNIVDRPFGVLKSPFRYKFYYSVLKFTQYELTLNTLLI